MQTRYIFCLLLSALVLAVAAQKPTTEVTLSNGFQCPTCRNQTNDTCIEQLTPCQGDETFCTNSTVKILNEDKTENSTLVIKGCVTKLVLSALLGTKDVEPGFIYDIQSAIEVASLEPTKPPSSTVRPPTTAKPAEKPPNTPADAATEKNRGSPHISSSLSFALCLLLMALLS